MQMTDIVKVPGAKYHPEPPLLDEQEEQEHSSTMRFGSMKIFSGSASIDLGGEIVDYICAVSEYNIKPGAYYRTVFSNENIFIKLEESVRGKDVYLVQTMSSPVHENFMEMLIMIDALKRDSAWRINLVVPYMSYTRSDKKDQPRVPITARLIANMMETAGIDRYMTIDLHAGQIQGFFDVPGDALTAFHLLSDYVVSQMRSGELGRPGRGHHRFGLCQTRAELGGIPGRAAGFRRESAAAAMPRARARLSLDRQCRRQECLARR